MKIFSFLSRIKFKSWRSRIDIVKVFPYFCVVLAFLPVLPHKKEDGKLISVLGFEAIENNFYLRPQDFELVSTIGDEKEEIVDQEAIESKNEKNADNYEGALTKIASYLENNGIAKIEGYRNYLETTNYSEELKKCLILRNTLMSSLVIDQEVKRLFNLYIPTPVPAIWLFRLILIQIIENIVGQYATYEVLEKGLKQCGDFENLWPSEKYLDLTFEEKN